jgi:hypothetical protein
MSKITNAPPLSSTGPFTIVDLPEENRSGVMKVVNPGGWTVAMCDLAKFKEHIVTITFSADVKRVGAAGELRWQINNHDYPTIGDAIGNAAADTWHSMSGQWTGPIISCLQPGPRVLYLSTWKNNSNGTTYYIDNFKIEIESKGKMPLTSTGFFEIVDLPEENRAGVMKIANPTGWAVAMYGLEKFKDHVVTLQFSADVKRVGGAGDLRWQINNDEYPTIGNVISNAAPDVWHSMGCEWTGPVKSSSHPAPRAFFLSTWNNNSPGTTYYIDNFKIEVTSKGKRVKEYDSDSLKSVVIPRIPDDFTVAAPFRHGLTDTQIKAGISAFRKFLLEYHDKRAAENSKTDPGVSELYDKHLFTLLCLIGIHGRLETEPRKELAVCGNDLLTLPKPKGRGLEKLSGKKLAVLFAYLTELGFYFEDADFSEKAELSKAGVFYVTNENNDDVIIGLKLLAEATAHIKTDQLHIQSAFMRCDFYPLESETSKKQAFRLGDYLHALPPEKRDWVQRLDAFLLENGCRVSGDDAVFTYTSRKSKKWVCILEFRQTGFKIKINCNSAKKLDGAAPELPGCTLASLRSDGCGCGGACPSGPFRISHGGEEFVSCRYVGFKFPLDDAGEREVVKKWITLELAGA